MNHKVEVSASNFQLFLSKKEEIDNLMNKIKQDTAGYSTHKHMMEHMNFPILVSMGECLVNYMFHQITEDGFDWLYIRLLEVIYNKHEVSSGNVYDHLIYWLTWYKSSDMYKKNDVYFNLV